MIFLSLAVFVVCTVVMVKRAFAEKTYWGLLSLIAPPSWPIFYAEHWKRYRVQGVVHLTSFIALLFFISLHIRAYPFEFDGTPLASVRNIIAPAFASTPLALDRYTFASEDDVNALADSMGKGVVLHFGGQDIPLERATLIDGMLRMRSLPDARPSIELAIDLRKTGLHNAGATLLDLGPDSIDHPPVYLFEYENLNKRPKITSYDRGFWLHLSIELAEDERVSGDIRLRLPDEDQSYLVGRFDASKKDLVWEIGTVRRDYDSNDTIEYISQQYLENKLGGSLEQVVNFRKTFFQTTQVEPTASTLATVALNDGSIQYVELSLYKDPEAGWIVEHNTKAGLTAALNTLEDMPAGTVPSLTPVRNRVFTVEQADSLLGNNVAVITQNGRSKEGIITSVDQHSLCLTLPLNGSEIVMMIRRQDVKQIQLME
ncbi:MAG: hypothetical protein D6160_04645 [Ketobacter sp.]|nr:MAG: hypothetical protein D6160_04645 [Ketobacter sp.]